MAITKISNPKRLSFKILLPCGTNTSASAITILLRKLIHLGELLIMSPAINRVVQYLTAGLFIIGSGRVESRPSRVLWNFLTASE